MTTIEKYFAQAGLAQAAYGTFSIGAIDTNALTNNKVEMTAAQAKHFVEEWTVDHQLEEETSSGFSAMLLKSKDGEYTLAIRGTTGGATGDDMLAGAERRLTV